MASVSTIINALMEKFSNDEGQLVIPQDELVKALGSMKAEKSRRLKRPELSVAYKEAKGDYTPIAPPVKYDVDNIPDAPEGWSGPFKMTYLLKVAKNPETEKNFKSFKTFQDAVDAANKLEEGCAGITKTSRGYSLRIGP